MGASLQRRGDVLVGFGRRRGQVPGRTIVMQARGEARCAAIRRAAGALW
ncbi:hypothetical protein ACFQX6_15230 [Streptosporangium lutulentum]